MRRPPWGSPKKLQFAPRIRLQQQPCPHPILFFFFFSFFSAPALKPIGSGGRRARRESSPAPHLPLTGPPSGTRVPWYGRERFE